jgi:hypothetical protein
MDTENKILGLLAAILVVMIVGTVSTFIPQLQITGAQTYTQQTESNATIQYYISISSSGNLSDGISFGTITTLPATDVNATKNYNSTVNPSWHNETLYWIAVSGDSNTPVDLCVKGDRFNTSGGNEIDLSNYNWSDNATTNNYTWPDLAGSYNLTNESYLKGSTDVAAGGTNYYRFWLSVPSGQAAGTYNNTVYFKAVQTGQACGT